MRTENLLDLIAEKQSSWDTTTYDIVAELWDRMEAAETDLHVFEMRLKKEWPTEGSNLYTPRDISKLTVSEISDIVKWCDFVK